MKKRSLVVILWLASAALVFVLGVYAWETFYKSKPAPVAGIQQLAPNLYVVNGGGGNTAVFLAEKGVVLVDTKYQDSYNDLIEQVRTVTDKPVTHVINTHFHRDHSEGNINVPAGTEIMVHENTADIFNQIWSENGYNEPPWRITQTFSNKMTLFEGDDAIDLYHFGPAHTGGDVIVLFRAARVIHAGDVFHGKAPPLINITWGGNGVSYLSVLELLGGLDGYDQVITGHDRVYSRADLQEYTEYYRLLMTHARDSFSAGKSTWRAAWGLELPAVYDSYKKRRTRYSLKEMYKSIEAVQAAEENTGIN